MSAHPKGRRHRPRTLSPDERRLWERVAATTDRRPAVGVEAVGALAGTAPDPMPVMPEITEPAPSLLVRTLRPAPRRGGPAVSMTLAGPEVGPVGRPEAGLDRRTATRLRKGARAPDARVDLHGMSAERAHRVCLLFLADALAQGSRVVLVITGKGRRGDGDTMSRGHGVLHSSLPGWLRASPLGASIVGIYQAHRRHGGEGAFYVYLKRRR